MLFFRAPTALPGSKSPAKPFLKCLNIEYMVISIIDFWNANLNIHPNNLSILIKLGNNHRSGWLGCWFRRLVEVGAFNVRGVFLQAFFYIDIYLNLMVH